MLVRIARILMNEADGSPGGGAAASGTQAAAPAQGAAQTAAPGSTAAPDPSMVQALASALGPALRDSVFAELRRTGVLKESKSKPADPAPSSQAQAQSPSLDIAQARRLDRALLRTGYANGLDDRGMARLERDFAAETPEDADSWVKDYFSSVGRTAPAQQQAAAQAANPSTAGTADPAKPATAAPASSAGNKVDPLTQNGLIDIWKLTPAQLDQLGPSGIRREFEKQIAEGNRLRGAPPVPRTPQRK